MAVLQQLANHPVLHRVSEFVTNQPRGHHPQTASFVYVKPYTSLLHFGNELGSHKSGSAYAYLKSARVYTTALEPWEASVEILVERIEETAHTYRMIFRLKDGEEISGEYLACFVKREDGSVYFRSLQNN